MKFIGVDLHRKTIRLCVMVLVGRQRKVVDRKRFLCDDTAAIRDFFAKQGDFQVVVEATANYEWFLLLVEDLARIIHKSRIAGAWATGNDGWGEIRAGSRS